jgi:hypothetical protein
VQGEAELLDEPKDWRPVGPLNDTGKHFLFYFRDETFECSAEKCVIEPSEENSLHRKGKGLHAD